jgi:hypothetical protein
VFAIAILLAAARSAFAQSDAAGPPPRILATDRAELRVVPLPVAVDHGAGSLDLRRGLTSVGVHCLDRRVARALVRFGQQLSQARGRMPASPSWRAAQHV